MLTERALQNYRVDEITGCWVWQGQICRRTGYSQAWDVDRRTHVRAHRWFYMHHVGPVVEGLQLHHICENRACVNPTHLEPVTPAEHTIRGNSPWSVNARKTHCKHGHPLSGENLRIRADGSRECKECSREKYRRWYTRHRERRSA